MGSREQQEERGPFALLLPPSDGTSGSADRPLVVLLGWAGAQRDGALLKYAEVLAGRGYASVRSVQPLLVAFSPLPWLRRNWALALLRYLEERQLWPQRRLVLYAFSNGGAFVVEQLMQIAESDPRYARLPATVAALILDSAPVLVEPGAVEGVVAATTPPGLRRWLLHRYIATTVWLRGPGGGMAAYWASLVRMGWGRPQLFFYSRDDPLANAARIDQLVAEKRALGQDVRSRCWDQSAHCTHLKHHPEEYSRLLFGLLEEVEQASGGSSGGDGGSGSDRGGGGGSGGSASGSTGPGVTAAGPANAPRARL